MLTMVLTETSSAGGSSQAGEQQMVKVSNEDGTSSSSSSSSSSTDAATSCGSSSSSSRMMAKDGIAKEITRGVIRAKLAKMRHLVIRRGIEPAYLDSIMPAIIDNFNPQTVTYNGGIAKVKEWKLSCYMEVMEGGVPCADPDLRMLDTCLPLLDCCDDLFASWYRQQHSCNDAAASGGRRRRTSTPTSKANDSGDTCAAAEGEENIANGERQTLAGGNHEKKTTQNQQQQQQRRGTDDGIKVKRLMTFITRYTAAPNENALLKHVDGAGKVDGSVVVALPIDRWTGPEEANSFEGHGGGLTFWDGKSRPLGRPQEIQYDTRSGDLAFIDRAVWHQANPITKGTRWALVIFYKVMES